MPKLCRTIVLLICAALVAPIACGKKEPAAPQPAAAAIAAPAAAPDTTAVAEAAAPSPVAAPAADNDMGMSSSVAEAEKLLAAPKSADDLVAAFKAAYNAATALACKTASPATLYRDSSLPCSSVLEKAKNAIAHPPAGLALDAAQKLAMRQAITDHLMMWLDKTRDDWNLVALYSAAYIFVRSPAVNAVLEKLMANPNEEVSNAAVKARFANLTTDDTASLEMAKAWLAPDGDPKLHSRGAGVVTDNAYMGLPGHLDFLAGVVTSPKIGEFTRSTVIWSMGFQRDKAVATLTKLQKKMAKAPASEAKIKEAVDKALAMAQGK